MTVDPHTPTCAGFDPHEDVLPFVRALVASHPQRLLWGSDWPHPLVQPTPNDGDIANLIAC